MITEWQPIMPSDEIKFKSRTLYELLKGDKTTELIVGQGVEHPILGSKFGTNDIVAWREFDCAGGRPAILATEPKRK